MALMMSRKKGGPNIELLAAVAVHSSGACIVQPFIGTGTVIINSGTSTADGFTISRNATTGAVSVMSTTACKFRCGKGDANVFDIPANTTVNVTIAGSGGAGCFYAE